MIEVAVGTNEEVYFGEDFSALPALHSQIFVAAPAR
jgi:hypothetical protein